MKSSVVKFHASKLSCFLKDAKSVKVFVAFMFLLTIIVHICIGKSTWDSFQVKTFLSDYYVRFGEIQRLNKFVLEFKEEWFVPRRRNKTETGLSYILYWRNHWGLKNWGWKAGIDLGGCVVTYNRSKIKDAEAVVFHYTGMDKEKFPWRHYRDEDQIFAFFNDESPSYMRWGENRASLSKFDYGFINITMTYRSDSSIYYPFPPDLKSILQQGKAWVDKRMAEKSKANVSLWIVSDCYYLPGAVTRMGIVNGLLKAGLTVHRFGKCFNNSDVINNMDKKALSSYKFYLSFENALHCKDYITEKFWITSIKTGKVPVVWGPSKEDVIRLAPTKSFIHYDDFDSPSSLASYLMYLNENDTAYREYLNWAENPDQRTRALVETTRLGQEKLCDLIKAAKRKRTIVKSVTNFYLNDSKECFQPIK